MVVARVAANRRRAQQEPLSLMVFRRSTNRWEPVGELGGRRRPADHDQEAVQRSRRRLRSVMMMAWPVILLDAVICL